MKRKILLLALGAIVTLASCAGGNSSSTTSSSGSSSTSAETSSSTPDSSISSESSESSTSSSTVTVLDYEITVTGEETMLYGRSQTLTATLTVDGVVDEEGVTWSSTDEDIATVTSAGVVTATGVGDVIITAVAVSNTNVAASINITVSYPTADFSSLNISTDYLLQMDASTSTATRRSNIVINSNQLYIYHSGGWYSDGYARGLWYWFEDDKVYNVENTSAGAYYYEGEYFVDDTGAAYSSADVLAQYNLGSIIESASFGYYGYSARYDLDYFYARPSESGNDPITDFVLSNSVIDLSSYSSTYAGYSSVLYVYNNYLYGEILGYTSSGYFGEETLLSFVVAYINNSASAMTTTPTKKYFHDGGEAGDEDGEGEDFDGDGGDTGEDTGDGTGTGE